MPHPSQCATEQWYTYANGGGVQEDDTRTREQMREAETEYLEFIRRSDPMATHSSIGNQPVSNSSKKGADEPKDTGLLLDLDIEPQIESGQCRSRDSYASVAAPTTGQTPYMNLLD
jgi:hypothetical protein